jgi:hypothetical protein
MVSKSTALALLALPAVLAGSTLEMPKMHQEMPSPVQAVRHPQPVHKQPLQQRPDKLKTPMPTVTQAIRRPKLPVLEQRIPTPSPAQFEQASPIQAILSQPQPQWQPTLAHEGAIQARIQEAEIQVLEKARADAQTDADMLGEAIAARCRGRGAYIRRRYYGGAIGGYYGMAAPLYMPMPQPYWSSPYQQNQNYQQQGFQHQNYQPYQGQAQMPRQIPQIPRQVPGQY